MRVLHLLDLRQGDVEQITACRAALQIAEAQHHVIAIGSARGIAPALSLGLSPDDVITPMGGPAELSARRLRRLVAARSSRGFAIGSADLLQCWSVATLGLARLAFSGGPRRVGALLRHPAHAPATLLSDARRSLALVGARLWCFDRSTRAGWAGAASLLRGDRFSEQQIRLLPPPASVRIEPADRAQLRARLGIREDQIAVGLVACPPRQADARRFAFVLGLLYTTGASVSGLVPRGVVNLARASRFVRLHGHGWGFQSSDLPLPTMLSACDLAVWDAPPDRPSDSGTSGSVGLAIAMSLGLPTVATRHGVSEALLRKIAPELLARDATQNALADRLLSIIADPSRRSAISADLQHAAAENTSAFRTDLFALWKEAANQPEDVAGLPTPSALARSLA
ncbi:MAG: hypothetical protein ACK4WH_01875 [Phycisphaerales bacterium]